MRARNRVERPGLLKLQFSPIGRAAPVKGSSRAPEGRRTRYAACQKLRAKSPRRMPMAAPVRFINPEGLVRSPAYTQVVETMPGGRTIYVSGQLGTAPDGKLAGADFRAQAGQVF